jgi:hypothetical protein
MIFKCKAYAAALEKDDIDLSSGIANCSHCRTVMSFAEDLRQTGSKVTKSGPRPEALRNEDLEVEDKPQRLRFTKPWYQPGLFFLLFFYIAWNGFLVDYYTIGFNASGPPKWIILLFPIVHISVGVGLLYTVITGFLNRTTVEVRSDRFSVRHGPIPFRGNQTLQAHQIKQLFCQGPIHRLIAVLQDNRKVTFLSKYTNHDLVLYLD